METLRLITIPMSHFCEKARWGLDRLGLPYREQRHIQLFHYLSTYLTSGGPNVPILIDTGRVIPDSTAILKHLDQYAANDKKLYPDQPALRSEVELLEDLFDEQLGVDSRRWLYYQMINQPWQLYTMAQGVPVIEKLLLPFAMPFIYLLIRSHPETLKKDVEDGMTRAQAIINQVDERLADGRPYLVGEHFSAADLSLACMMSPFIVPAEYGIRLPELDDLPPAMKNAVIDFRNTPTGRHVLKMFRTERCLPATNNPTKQAASEGRA